MSDGQQQSGGAEATAPACPTCGGEMWDNRAAKKNPRAPDYKCKTAGCEGVIWPPREAGAPAPTPAGTADDPACPVCGGKMWDDRATKRNPRAPDFKCRNKPKAQGLPGCPGVIWPPREGERRPASKPAARSGGNRPSPSHQAADGPARRTPPASAPPPPPAREFTDDEVPDFGDDELPF
jgi:hypothetical protein